MDLTVILPARDEEQSVGDVVRRVREILPGAELLVVDDGSRDATSAEAAAAGATVLVHPYPIGNGGAVKTGLRAARGEVVVLLDADGQHPPESIPQLLEGLRGNDMAVGARPPAAQATPVRGWGNRILTALARRLSGYPIRDLTSGFRAVRRDRAIEFLHLLPNGFSYPTTLTLAMAERGYFIEYVDVPAMAPRTSGRSKIRIGTDGVRFLQILARMAMLFYPEKVFAAFGGLLLVAGVGMGIWKALGPGELYGTVLLLLISGLFTTLFGLLASQVAALRRERMPDPRAAEPERNPVARDDLP